jgi:hypothetical protein
MCGVIEVDPAHYVAPSLSLVTDATWLVITPAGNQSGQSITSVGAAFEAANPGWNTSLTYNTSSWSVPRVSTSDAIWGATTDSPAYLRKTFHLNAPVSNATLLATADDDAIIYINGVEVARDTNKSASGFGPLDVTNYLTTGDNLIAVKGQNAGGPDSFTLHLLATAAPEPSTLAVLGVGVGAIGLLALVRRRRRKGLVSIGIVSADTSEPIALHQDDAPDTLSFPSTSSWTEATRRAA